MEGSALFITAVFLLGASVGGLLVSLQRQCAIDRIRSEFSRELALAVVHKSRSASSARVMVPNTSPVSEPSQVQRDEALEDAVEEEFCWEHFAAPPQGDSRPHAGI